MPIAVTREELIKLKPCDLDERLAMFGRRKAMTARQAFAAGASIRDLLWVAQAIGRKDLCIRFAVICAQRAGRFTKDARVHDCLAATEKYIGDPSATNLKALKAGRAAAYAADAADAADAAADAAAYAAADAAAYAAAREKEIKAQKAIFIKLFS